MPRPRLRVRAGAPFSAVFWCSRVSSCPTPPNYCRALLSPSYSLFHCSSTPHTLTGLAGFGEFSLFHGRLIPRRVPTAWGALSIMEAERLLLQEALADPLNERCGGREAGMDMGPGG